MCLNRIMDFGTTEGIIAEDISESFRIKIFELVKIKFIVCFLVVIALVLVGNFQIFNGRQLILFSACYVIIFIREYSFSVFLSLREKNGNDISTRPHLGILLPGLQITFCYLVFLLLGHLRITHLLICSLLALSISSFVLFKSDFLKCIKARLSLINTFELFKSNYYRYKYQVTISWISVVNKLLESNIIFFLIGREQFASFALYQIGSSACLFLVKYYRVRSVVIILKYQNWLAKLKYYTIILILFVFVVSSSIYFSIVPLIFSLDLVWFVREFILISLLIPSILIAFSVDWVFVAILRNSKNKKYEVNKTFLTIALSYLFTFLLSYLALHGLSGAYLLYFIAVKDLSIIIFSSIYVMWKVKVSE